MGNAIRSIIYGLLFISCLSLAVIGIDERLTNPKANPTKEKVKEETLSCTLTKDTYVDSSNQTVDYTTSSDLTLIIADGNINSKAITETVAYKDKERYTTRKNKLVKAGAKYNFNDEKLSFSHKKSLEQSALDGVNITIKDIKARLESLGYVCK